MYDISILCQPWHIEYSIRKILQIRWSLDEWQISIHDLESYSRSISQILTLAYKNIFLFVYGRKMQNNSVIKFWPEASW